MFFNFGHEKRSSFLIIITLILCVYMSARLSWHECGGQRIACRKWFSPSTIWGPGFGQQVPLLSCWLLRPVFTSSDDSLDRVIQTLRRKLGKQKPQTTTLLYVKPAELWGFWPFGQIKDSSPTKKVGGWVDGVWISHPWLFELSMSLLPDIVGEKESARILD